LTTTIALLSPGTVNFEFLAQRVGSKEGGRKLFEQLVEDTVALIHPDVSTIAANPGDWGIDAYVGELLRGQVSVWQSKYFIDGFGTTQQKDVRDSYKSAMNAAAKNGYKVTTWTLCIPVALDGPMTKWWSGWKKRTSKADNVVIELWDEGFLRRRLQHQDDDTRRVFTHYFNPVVTIGTGSAASAPVRPLEELTDPSRFDDTLFVKQMVEAKLTATRTAREAFFNAEILGQEIADKAVTVEIDALRNWRMRIASTWEYCFNDATQQHSGTQLPTLYRDVLETIEKRHSVEAATLRASMVHGHGLMHQEVEAARAGWVRHWERVAAQHTRPAAASSTTGTLAAATPTPNAPIAPTAPSQTPAAPATATATATATPAQAGTTQ